MAAPVLIVDSDRDGREMYITALALAGIEAEGAASATEALAVIARTHPRAIVTELRLSDAAGGVLARTVRRRQPGTFIVGLSTEMSSTAGPALDGSCDVVLPVPCLPETLIRQLRPVLG